ncbi:MAG TPA: DUF378 domain-containing protein, partial [Thermoleophilia bacterium]|nr:DUF378 domain-containing protein [Thermoleophilia bacterium]
MSSSRMEWRIVGWTSLLIATIGALSWGLVGLFTYSATAPGFRGLGRVPDFAQGFPYGSDLSWFTTGSRVVYTIVGIAGVVALGVFIQMVRSRLSAWRVVSGVAVLLTAIGAINWGLIGLFEYDLVAEVVGQSYGALVTGNRALYTIIGAAGLVSIGSLVD